MFGLTAVEAGTLLVGAAGVGTALYGANKQADASSAANAQNQSNVTNANNESWTNYLASRGLNPGGTVPYGTIPTNAAPINTKLPLWATINVPNQFLPGGSGGGASLPGGGGNAAGGYVPRGMTVGGSSAVSGNPGGAVPGSQMVLPPGAVPSYAGFNPPPGTTIPGF